MQRLFLVLALALSGASVFAATPPESASKLTAPSNRVQDVTGGLSYLRAMAAKCDFSGKELDALSVLALVAMSGLHAQGAVDKADLEAGALKGAKMAEEALKASTATACDLAHAKMRETARLLKDGAEQKAQ